MIIVLRPGSSKETAEEILSRIEKMGCKPLYMPGTERVVLGAIGDERVLESLQLEGHPAVESVSPVLAPYKMVSRELHPHDSVIKIGADLEVGSNQFAVIAGPCAVESYDQLDRTAEVIQKQNVKCLRAGAFKPRTSPYSFQGLGGEGIALLSRVSKQRKLAVVTELVEIADIDLVTRTVDAIQIGTRNMQNFRLLEAVGDTDRPVILKRGMAATIKDLLLAAEYIVSRGNPNVILCERGIKTFEQVTRNTLDLSAVAYIKQRSHLPVIVDPSHGTGVRELVSPMTRAAAACGADGVMIEVHVNPSEALSDGKQSLYPDQFAALMRTLKPVLQAVGREL